MHSSPPEPPTLAKAPAPDKRTGPRAWAAVLFALALAGVIWGSLTPSPPSLEVSHIDKVQHFGAYALLTALAYLTCRGRWWRVALALALLGVGVEFAQAAEAMGRQASALDALANAAGVTLVSLAWPRR